MGLTSHGQTKLNFQTAICSILHAQPYRGISIGCSWKQTVSKCPSDFKRGADSQHTTSLKNMKKHGSWFWVSGLRMATRMGELQIFAHIFPNIANVRRCASENGHH